MSSDSTSVSLSSGLSASVKIVGLAIDFRLDIGELVVDDKPSFLITCASVKLEGHAIDARLDINELVVDDKSSVLIAGASLKIDGHAIDALLDINELVVDDKSSVLIADVRERPCSTWDSSLDNLTRGE